MLFIVFTFATGLLFVAAPFFLLRLIVKKWHIQAKIFWKAGFAGIFTATIVLGVIVNMESVFPSFSLLPVFAQALILGCVSGLFVELGKFVVLDRWLRSVRRKESVVLFGIGWSAVGLILLGILLSVGALGMYNLANTKDFISVLPNADQEQLQFLMDGQKQVQTLMNGSPLRAFSPLLENLAIMTIDIAMSFLIVFGITKKQTRYTWMAVGVRAMVATSLFFVVQTKTFPVELLYAGWIVMGALFFRFISKSLPEVSDRPAGEK